jgi:hypothetical protein
MGTIYPIGGENGPSRYEAGAGYLCGYRGGEAVPLGRSSGALFADFRFRQPQSVLNLSEYNNFQLIHTAQ